MDLHVGLIFEAHVLWCELWTEGLFVKVCLELVCKEQGVQLRADMVSEEKCSDRMVDHC